MKQTVMAVCTLVAFAMSAPAQQVETTERDNGVQSPAATDSANAVSALQFVPGEAVDMGLSVKWATYNVGAAAPEECGGYYAWGETESKYNYTDKTSRTRGVKMKNISGTEYDVAHVKWGGNWRMPTIEEVTELVVKCNWKRTEKNGVIGYLVTGRTGNTIFLPAAGYRHNTSLHSRGTNGYYWCGSGRRRTYGYGFILQMKERKHWDYYSFRRFGQ
ncbi:MAG: hypothetical protein HUK02_08425, partial [Bacteroidaceae bacterium]|nr:hypothetical protein [Bacteroidaceae bacterium]